MEDLRVESFSFQGQKEAQARVAELKDPLGDLDQMRSERLAESDHLGP